NFELVIGGSFSSSSPEGPYTFSVSGTENPSPWPSSGNWFFGGDVENQIIRDDNDDGDPNDLDDMAISYELLSDGNLSLQFDCDDCDFAGSKVKNVNGVW